MKYKLLCVAMVGLSAVALAQSPSPLLLQHIASRGSSGSGSPTMTNDSTVALVKIAGPAL
jgi:hypothetical protein